MNVRLHRRIGDSLPPNIECLGITCVILGNITAYNVNKEFYTHMPSENLHKLVSAFLAIAVLASSSAFGFSYWRNQKPVRISEENGSNVPKNAFVESLPESENGNIGPAAGYNMTQGLAAVLAAEVVTKNPNGPEERGGEETIVFPGDADALLNNYIASHPSTPELILPVIDPKNISFTNDNGAIEKYATKLSETAASFESASVVGASPEEWIGAVKIDFGTAVNNLKNAEVPESLSEIHINFLELFSASENYFGLIQQDPVAAAALMGDFENYNNERLREMEKILSAYENSSGPKNAFAKLFRINVAHATLPTIDYVHIAQSILSWLKKAWEIAQEVLMEYAKNYLLREMSRQIVNWVLGNGEPQFITNWEAFFRNAADEAVGAIIQEAAPNLCGAGLTGYLGQMSSIVRGLMKPIDIGQKKTFPTCTLTEVIQNVEDFRNDIRNGGWLGYSAVFEPQNTFFGQFVSLSQRSAAALSQKREALVNKLDKGYLPTEQCEEGQKATPTGGCAEADTEALPDPSKTLGKDDSGNLTVEPVITAPANIKSSVTVRSFDAAYDRIVATSGKAGWAAMGAFVLDAMITKLVASGIKGLGGAANVQYTDSGGSETPSLTIEGRAEQVRKFKSTSLASARTTQTLLGQTISTFSQVEQACVENAAVVADAKKQKSALASLRGDLTKDVVTLADELEALEQFIKDIKTKRYTFADLDRQFGKGKKAFDAAREEMTKFGRQRTYAETTLQETSNVLASCDPQSSSYIPPDTTSTSTGSGGGF